jgi:hypothetical protein
MRLSSSSPPSLSARASVSLLAVVVVSAGVWLGCASKKGGDPAIDEPLDDGGTTAPGPDDQTPPTPGTDPDAGPGQVPPPTCTDTPDPGGTEALAAPLSTASDCDLTPNETVVRGVLNGKVDVDFWKFPLSDGTGCSIEPLFVNKTAETELCVFLKCQGGLKTNFKGCTSGTKAVNATGMDGCCAVGPGTTAVPDWSCGGLTDFDYSSDFIVRMKPTTGDKCVPYSWTYAF